MSVMLIDSTQVRFASDLLTRSRIFCYLRQRNKRTPNSISFNFFRQLSFNAHRICFFALQFTAEEIQVVNEMERMALDKVRFTPFPL